LTWFFYRNSLGTVGVSTAVNILKRETSMRKLWLVLVVNVLVISGVGGDLAQAKLDPSFGQNGVVSLSLSTGPGDYEEVSAMTAARDGSAYVLSRRLGCPPAGGYCAPVKRLQRYAPDGVRDPAFAGSGSYDFPSAYDETVHLAVDSEGRLLLAKATEGRIVVHRLTTSGSPDQGFGEEGSVTLECECESRNAQLVPGRAGALTVVVPGWGQGYGHKGIPLTLFRLRADGSSDSRFGKRGVSKLTFSKAGPLVSSANAPGGGLYLAGAGCCGPDHPIIVGRVSVAGRFDKHFAKVARHALGSLDRIRGSQIGVSTVLVRPGGKIELLGSTGYEKRGFQVRLTPTGSLQRRFGKGGLRVLPEPVSSAALGSEGATLALSSNGLTNKTFLARILAGGRLDRSFDPEAISGFAGRYQVSVVPVVGRKVLVLDPGVNACRSYCPPQPHLIRLLEGPPPKRR
jgi:uncharacterized delta-60 repeat protein